MHAHLAHHVAGQDVGAHKTLAQGPGQRRHPPSQPHRGRRIRVAAHALDGQSAALDQHVAAFVLGKPFQSEVAHQAVELRLDGGPEPGGTEVEAAVRVRFARSDGQDASAKVAARFEQHVVVHAVLLEQAGGVQAGQAAADDGNPCTRHRSLPSGLIGAPSFR